MFGSDDAEAVVIEERRRRQRVETEMHRACRVRVSLSRLRDRWMDCSGVIGWHGVGLGWSDATCLAVQGWCG